jgi:hypothetical protein
MIVDILQKRNIKKDGFKTNEERDQKFDMHFCTINLVVEDIKIANEGIIKIVEFTRMFKASNDPTESNNLYKKCQNENRDTDKKIKSAKKFLQQEKKEIEELMTQEKYKYEPEMRFRKMCSTALQGKIFQMIKRLQKLQMEIKSESQQKMKDRIKMYDNNIGDDELEDLIKDPEVAN